MKKYLMMAAAGLVMGASFTSCSKDKDLYDPQGQALKFLQDYQAAFISVFGTPASNQTWGFGSASASRMTRANNPGEGFAETSTGINANANEWADPTPGKTFGGLVVPDPLTEDQKAVVAAYFQTVTPLTYEDPHWRNFFVQQVYKGGTSTVRNTTEGIKDANGVQYSSDNMNLLTVGYNDQHINNFNAGSYSGATNNTYTGGINADGTVNVLDKDWTANDFAEHHHPDQIMLMANIDDTECMGYHCSATGVSLQRNDKAALVGWETIDTWARSNYPGYDGCLKDDWNRSYVGFDLALKSLEDSYAKVDGDYVYAMLTDFTNLTNVHYVYEGTTVKEIVETAPAAIEDQNITSDVLSGATTEGGGSITQNTETGYWYWSGGNFYKNLDIDLTGYTKMVIEYDGVDTNSTGNYAIEISVEGNLVDWTQTRPMSETKVEVNITNATKLTWLKFMNGAPRTIKSITLSAGSAGDYYTSNYILGNGQQLRYMDSNMNQYAGQNETLTDDELQITVDGKLCLNLNTINDLVTRGFLPVKGSALKTWAKWADSDGYYSDWIVTLTRAQRINENPTLPTLRVIAEDLTAEDAGDFDFNDVVFDAEYISANEVKVTIQAAGGTLPLTVYGQEVHAMFIAQNPGAKTDQGGTINVKTMINTDALSSRPSEPYSSAELTNLPVINITQYNDWSDDNDTFAEQVRDRIPVVVTKTDANGRDISIELTAQKGKTPGKVGVPTTYKWKGERIYIGDGFKKFVKDPSHAMWWRE